MKVDKGQSNGTFADLMNACEKTFQENGFAKQRGPVEEPVDPMSYKESRYSGSSGGDVNALEYKLSVDGEQDDITVTIYSDPFETNDTGFTYRIHDHYETYFGRKVTEFRRDFREAVDNFLARIDEI